MKMTRRDFLRLSSAAAAACGVTLLPAQKADAASEIQTLLEEAYLYAFPLVLVDATKTVSTNAKTPSANRAPVNQFIHARKLLDASSRTVVSPNVDTIYTQAWLDVSAEPQIYVVPETDRFFNVQVLDAWTNTAAVLEAPGAYAIAYSGWEGTLPEGVRRIDVPTRTVWTIARIMLSGPDDLPNVAALQSRMQLMPLSAYPAEADAPLLRSLAALSVGPGERFDASVLGPLGGLRWKRMLLQLKSSLRAQAARYARQMGQWTYYGDPIGDFGTAYDYRTMVALMGLGANTTDVAIYPRTSTDSTGADLTGKKTYTLHFDALPPTVGTGFWSVTAYGEDNFLIDNPISRYCVNDRSGLHRNPDGSIDVTLSKDAPEDTTNWLPVSDEKFHLFLRIYKPDWTALDSFPPPVIRVK